MGISRHACRAIGITTVIFLNATAASARTSLVEAYDRWFRSDRSIVCVDPDGNARRCAPSEDTTMSVHKDPATSTALVFATYLPDPTGNGVATVAAVFHEGADGWTFARSLAEVPQLPPEKVTFREGIATFTAATFQLGDPRCCPSGRKAYSVRLP